MVRRVVGRLAWAVVLLMASLGLAQSRLAESRAFGVAGKAVFAPVTAAAPEHNAALFVGINTFVQDESLRPLTYAVEDAVAQAHLFCLELKLIPPRHCYLALSGEPATDTGKQQLAALIKAGATHGKALKPTILKQLLTVQALAEKPADLVIVSISSHGFEARGVAYAMPADGLKSALEDTALSLASVEQKLANSKAGKRLLLIDACREKSSTEGKGGDSPMSQRFREALAKADGQATLASCDAGQISLEAAELGHGLFTYYLLESLRGKAPADATGFVTLGSVSEYVSKGVSGWASKHRPELDKAAIQRPWFKGPKDAEQIPLAIQPELAERLARAAAEAAKLLETRLSALKTLYLDQKLTLEQYQMGQALLRAARLDEQDQQRRAEYIQVIGGQLKSEHLQRALDAIETPAQRAARLAKEASIRAEQVRQVRIAELLSQAQDNDSKEKGKVALAALEELLKLDANHNAGNALYRKISAYYGPRVIENSIGIKLIEIKPGTFTMGTPEGEEGRYDDEGPQHKVTLTKGFFMGRTPVTQAQWKAVMGDNPSHFKGDDSPVEQVSWNAAVAFCRKLSAKEGKTYRLPTEAEWEYACRAGTQTAYYTGDGEEALKKAGWYDRNSDDKTHPVGQKAPNAWGLYDMHGNVFQWCSDWFGKYPAEAQTDPTGSENGTPRVLRGGSWDGNPRVCRSGYRNGVDPSDRSHHIGFRLVLDSN